MQSETVKTWDGLRVKREYWDPRHPQLDVKGVPETSMRVIDGRPEQPWKFAYADYGSGPLILGSPNNTIYKVVVSNTGTPSTQEQPYQPLANSVIIGGYSLEVSNTGVLSTDGATETGYLGWMIVSPDGQVWVLTLPSGVVVTTAI